MLSRGAIIVCFLVLSFTKVANAQNVEVGFRLGGDLIYMKQYRYWEDPVRSYVTKDINHVVIHPFLYVPVSTYFNPELRVGIALFSESFGGTEVGLFSRTYFLKKTLYVIAGGWVHWGNGAYSRYDIFYVGPFHLLAVGLGIRIEPDISLEVQFLKPLDDNLGHDTISIEKKNLRLN